MICHCVSRLIKPITKFSSQMLFYLGLCYFQAEPEGLKEEAEPERSLTLEELLAKVGLQEKKTLFEQEQIDMESLVSFLFCTVAQFSRNEGVFVYNFGYVLYYCS